MTKAGSSTRRRSVVVLGVFLYLWVMVTVALAALALLGYARWRGAAGTVPATGSLALTVAAALLLLVSFLLARFLLRRTLLGRGPLTRAVIPTIVTLLALAAAWVWLSGAGAPAAAPIGGNASPAPFQQGPS